MQGQRDLGTVGKMLLSELTPLVNAHLSVIYLMDAEDEEPKLNRLAGYASSGKNGHANGDSSRGGDAEERLRIGEGLVGQCAAEKQRLLITQLPANAAPIRSGLFEAPPRNVVVLPVLFENQIKAVIELASLSVFTASHLAFLDQLTASIGILLNSIEATMKTEGLLKQSQQLATELQSQQKELQEKNEQLAQKATATGGTKCRS